MHGQEYVTETPNDTDILTITVWATLFTISLLPVAIFNGESWGQQSDLLGVFLSAGVQPAIL